MTQFDTIRVFLTKLVLLAGAKALRSRWYAKYQDFEYWLIYYSRLVPGIVLESSLVVPSSSLKSLTSAWRYLTEKPQLDVYEEEDPDDYLDEEYDDEYDDENAAVKLLARYIFTPEFEEAIQEHPEWTKFLI